MNTLGHDIEVEDDVVGLLKWPGGATGMIHVTTNEAPGRNFLEVSGTRGTLLLEDKRLKAIELAEDSRRVQRNVQGAIGERRRFSEARRTNCPRRKRSHAGGAPEFRRGRSKGRRAELYRRRGAARGRNSPMPCSSPASSANGSRRPWTRKEFERRSREAGRGQEPGRGEGVFRGAQVAWHPRRVQILRVGRFLSSGGIQVNRPRSVEDGEPQGEDRAESFERPTHA